MLKFFLVLFKETRIFREILFFNFLRNFKDKQCNVVKFFNSLPITGVFCRGQVLDPLVVDDNHREWADTVNSWFQFEKTRQFANLYIRKQCLFRHEY